MASQHNRQNSANKKIHGHVLLQAKTSIAMTQK
jgi:hypothetical protein